MGDIVTINRTVYIELIIIFVTAIIVFILAGRYDFLERLIEILHQYEDYELDELITVSLFFVFASAFFAVRRWFEFSKLNQSLQRSKTDLENAVGQIRQLKEILPICSSCKKIRDDKGDWYQVESYISKKTATQFSHSICPECSDKIYGDEDWYTKE